MAFARPRREGCGRACRIRDGDFASSIGARARRAASNRHAHIRRGPVDNADSSATLRTAGVLHDWARTDTDGRYTLQTVRPAPYPGRRDPAHIHVEVMPPGGPACYVDVIEFDDDPLLTAQQRRSRDGFGGFGIVHATRVDDGTWQATHTITLWPANFTVPLRVNGSASEVRWIGTKFGGRGRHEGTVALRPSSLQLGGDALISGTLTFPIESLQITDIPVWEPVPRGHLRIFASLTIRDGTRDIAFDASLRDPPEASVVAEAEFTIDRHLWGLRHRGSQLGNDLLDDEITFRVRLVARRENR